MSFPHGCTLLRALPAPMAWCCGVDGCAVDTEGSLMHTYPRRWLERALDPRTPSALDGSPSASGAVPELVLRGVADVVDWAADDSEFGSADWIDVLHLSEEGELRCQCTACSCDSLVGWAADPTPLHRLRFDGLDRADCGSDWLVVDSRTRESGICIPPCSADDLAFTLLRRELSLVGVRLLDAVVFDDEGHWWSMLERTTGSTDWFGAQPGTRDGSA